MPIEMSIESNHHVTDNTHGDTNFHKCTSIKGTLDCLALEGSLPLPLTIFFYTTLVSSLWTGYLVLLLLASPFLCEPDWVCVGQISDSW